jgi:hypothetical protein
MRGVGTIEIGQECKVLKNELSQKQGGGLNPLGSRLPSNRFLPPRSGDLSPVEFSTTTEPGLPQQAHHFS